MATPGKDAFTPDTHAELLKLAGLLSDIELAVKYDTSLPTIQKWKKMPLGYQGGRSGRKKKARTTGMVTGHDTPKAGVGTDAEKDTAFVGPNASAQPLEEISNG